MAQENVILPPNVISIPDEFTGYPLHSFLIPDHYKNDLECVLISAGALRDRTQRLAADIFSFYPPGEPLLLICVLKSALGFFNALMASLQSLNNSPAASHNKETGSRSHLLLSEFIRVRSYVNDTSSGSVEITGISDMAASVAGQNVIIVEDMIDTGSSMKHTLDAFSEFTPKSLKVATLLRKRCPNSTGYVPDFLGFDIPNRFVVGFFVDYNQYFRDVEHLCVVNENGKTKYASKKTKL